MISILRRAIALVLVVLALGLTSCGGDRDVPVVLLPDGEPKSAANPLIGAIAEVSPPERIQQLKPYLDVYEPQVRIARPDPDETVTSATVQVDLQVRDFPIYKDQSLGFGPHLHLFVDDQPHQAIYDAAAPIILEDLAPGTHTLRLLAVRPWGESFKNEGAYDQITFNVFAASPQNNPDDSQPVLTYNQPQDQYGAEPILLDFHLHNAPPHVVAQADDTIMDWQIRCTINGESFIFDRWQPIYLQGFQPGKNWVRLELSDENGNLIDNAFNSSIRVIDYQPGGADGLSKLVRGEISLAQAKVLIDPSYEPPALTMPESTEPAAETVPEPAEPAPEPAETPTPKPTPDTAKQAAPASSPPPEPVTAPVPSPEAPPAVEPETEPAPESVKKTSESTTEAPAALETPGTEEMDERSPEAATEKPTPVVKPDTPETVQGDRAQPPADPSVEAPASSVISAPSADAQSDSPDASGDAAANPAAEPDTAEPAATATPETEQSVPAPVVADDAETAPAPSPEPATSTSGKRPAANAPKSNLDGVTADDLTEDSPLMESQPTNFPEGSPAVEPPLTPEAADPTLEAPDALSSKGSSSEAPDDLEAPTTTGPETDLKTLEDNADLI